MSVNLDSVPWLGPLSQMFPRGRMSERSRRGELSRCQCLPTSVVASKEPLCVFLVRKFLCPPASYLPASQQRP